MMTNLALAAVALGLVIGRVVAQRQEPFCKHNEYPSRIDVGEYGEIRFQCSVSECGHIQPKCNQIFFELSCKNKQWVGGVAASSNLNNLVPLQCCDVPAMARARPRGTKVVGPGGHFAGEQLRDARGNLVAFDVIRNVQKVPLDRNRYALEVHVARLSCKGKGPGLESAQLGLGGGGDQFHGDIGIDDLEEHLPLDEVPFEPGRVPEYGRVPDYGVRPEIPAEFPPPAPLPPAAPFAPPAAAPAAAPGGLAALVPAGLGGLGGVGAAGAGAGVCFASDTTVETPSGHKTMEELKIGDQVLTVNNGVQKFTPVTSFLHRLPEQHARFNLIQAEDGTSLKLTPKHFIYTGSCHNTKAPVLKFAEEVKPGECWIKVDSELQTQSRVPISSNTILHQTGAYAPLTENGAIVVDGVLASCYAEFNNEEFMNSFVYYADKLKDAVGGVFNAVGAHLPEGTTELPWLVKYGRAHLDKLILNLK